MISIEDLSRDWPNFSLRDIDLEVRDGEYFVILGPTGSGKTLLLELIAGFYKPDEGRIRIGGRDVTWRDPEDRKVGFVYQDYSLFPHLTVGENIRYGLEVNDFSKDAIREKTERMVNILGIGHLTERYPKNLSGGEQQKTALARGLVLDPDVLLLDEPVSALDMPTQEEMRGELKRIHREMEMTTLHVTHSRKEASWLADRIGLMRGGRVIQVGSPEDIFRKPKSEFVADFVGVENVFEGVSTCEDGICKIEVDGGLEIEAVSNKEGDVKACIRSDEILVSKQPVRSSGRNMVGGTVKEVVNLESTVRLLVDAGEDFTVLVTKKSLSEMGIEVGDEVYLIFKASSVHVM